MFLTFYFLNNLMHASFYIWGKSGVWCVCVCVCVCLCVQSFSNAHFFATPWTVWPLSSWDFLGKKTGVGCHFLLQGIFPNQGSNSGLPHCRQTLYRLSHQGIPCWSWDPTTSLLFLESLLGGVGETHRGRP